MTSAKERVLRVLEGLPDDAVAAEVEAAVGIALAAANEREAAEADSRPPPRARQSDGSRRRRSDIYLHLVWTTYRRLPMLTDAIEQQVFAAMVSAAYRTGAHVLAIGGMPDHVHVALRLPRDVTAAELVKRMKGASSTLVRTRLAPAETFGWQTSYGAYSFSRSHARAVIAYVQNQKRRHAAQRLWAPWETSDST